MNKYEEILISLDTSRANAIDNMRFYESIGDYELARIFEQKIQDIEEQMIEIYYAKQWF